MEPYKQVGMDKVVTSNSLVGVLVSILQRHVGLIPILGAIFQYTGVMKMGDIEPKVATHISCIEDQCQCRRLHIR